MLPYINIPDVVPVVPFYSQFEDIQSVPWQRKGCGIASLAMIIAYYKPDAVTVDQLLLQGIASGAYLHNAGWKHRDLVLLGQKYGLEGDNYDLAQWNQKAAYAEFKDFLKDGPVIASIYYKFDPKSTIPHLVVIDGLDAENDVIYYNDPAEKGGQKQISVADFQRGWKKRFIVLRPELVPALVSEGNAIIFPSASSPLWGNITPSLFKLS